MGRQHSIPMSFLFLNIKMEGISFDFKHSDHLLEDGQVQDSLQLQNGREGMELDLQETLELLKF
jgi:hypothetical protein